MRQIAAAAVGNATTTCNSSRWPQKVRPSSIAFAWIRGRQCFMESFPLGDGCCGEKIGAEIHLCGKLKLQGLACCRAVAVARGPVLALLLQHIVHETVVCCAASIAGHVCRQEQARCELRSGRPCLIAQQHKTVVLLELAISPDSSP